ncbi:MAG: DUF6125 family protein [Promethearchaeia archaeon]
MREVTDKDKLFFFSNHWDTLDGLWIIETENRMGFDRALQVDLAVWGRLLRKIIKRVKKHLNLKQNSIKNLIRVLSFRWAVEGWDFDLLDNGTIKINKCPYNESMKRNPDRHDKIIPICKEMCIPFYKEVVNHYNSKITLKRKFFQGLDDSTYCDFQFYQDGVKYKPTEKTIMDELDDDDKLYYFEKNFFTMDDLWIREVENETDWATALEIDIKVWQRLYKTAFRRVARYLDLESNTLYDLIEILSFLWGCEGYKYKIIKNTEKEAIIHITECPYEVSMRRNPNRHNKLEDICKKSCVPFYEPALKKFNPKITLTKTKFIETGDSVCNFHFQVEE